MLRYIGIILIGGIAGGVGFLLATWDEAITAGAFAGMVVSFCLATWKEKAADDV